MGKVDDLRAMREARYAAATRTVKAAAPPTKPVTPGPNGKTSAKTAAKPARTAKLRVVTDVETVELPEPGALFGVTEPEAAPEVEEELCGHRAISGKTCIRENKHAEKNHKYPKS